MKSEQRFETLNKKTNINISNKKRSLNKAKKIKIKNKIIMEK